MASDPDLLDAFRKQCVTFGADAAFLLWRGQAGVEEDDLGDILKEFDRAT